MPSPAAPTQRQSQNATVAGEVRHLRDLSPQQWRSGIAAWLGWLFDGLDMHLYTLVYAQFVAELLHVSSTADPSVGRHASIIQGGGASEGRPPCWRLTRTRSMALSIAKSLPDYLNFRLAPRNS